MYTFDVEKKLEKQLCKLSRRDPVLAQAVDKKMDEILANPHHYKPLQYPLQNKRRVHFKNQVLTFEIDENNRVVKFLLLKPHDEAYL